jgi:hypothetical protein
MTLFSETELEINPSIQFKKKQLPFRGSACSAVEAGISTGARSKTPENIKTFQISSHHLGVQVNLTFLKNDPEVEGVLRHCRADSSNKDTSDTSVLFKRFITSGGGNVMFYLELLFSTFKLPFPFLPLHIQLLNDILSL